MFNPIKKTRVKELEIITTTYINVLMQTASNHHSPMMVHEFHNWANHDWHAIDDDDSIFNKGLYEKVNYISVKLGMKQSYYVIHSCKNAVWGFEFNGNEFLLYFSNEGLGLQMLDTVTPDEVNAVIAELISRWKT